MGKMKDEFLKKCREENADDAGKTIERASLKWFAGTPAPAEEGFGALAVAENTCLTFSSDDVKAVEKGDKEGEYKIGLDAEASVIFTQKRVANLGGCDCEKPDPADGPGRVSYRYDLNKVAGFPIDVDYPIFLDAGGYVHPCTAARRKTFDDCYFQGGHSYGECVFASNRVEDQCRRSFF